jgi:hypothetical protein
VFALERPLAWCLLVLTGTALAAAFTGRVIIPALKVKKKRFK